MLVGGTRPMGASVFFQVARVVSAGAAVAAGHLPDKRWNARGRDTSHGGLSVFPSGARCISRRRCGAGRTCSRYAPECTWAEHVPGRPPWFSKWRRALHQPAPSPDKRLHAPVPVCNGPLCVFQVVAGAEMAVRGIMVMQDVRMRGCSTWPTGCPYIDPPHV